MSTDPKPATVKSFIIPAAASAILVVLMVVALAEQCHSQSPALPAPVEVAQAPGSIGPEAPVAVAQPESAEATGATVSGVSGPPAAEPAAGAEPPAATEPESAPVEQAVPAPVRPAEAKEGHLNIIGTVPLPGEKLENMIALFFDGEVVIPTAPEGTPAAPFEITPPLRGEFRTGANYAAFVLAPNQDLPPNEFYEVRLNRQLTSTDGKQLNPEQYRLRVATFAFEPQRVWVLEQSDAQTMLGVLFPVAVDLGAFREHLTVTDGDDTPLSFELEQGTSETSLRLRFAGTPKIPIKLNVAAGLQDTQGLFTLAHKRTFTYPAEPFFHVKEVKWGGRSPGFSRLVIEFSKPVMTEDLKWNAVFTHMPDNQTISFEVESRDTGPSSTHSIRLLREGVLGAVKVSLSSNLPGDGQTRLVEDYSEVLPPSPDPLNITGTQWGPSDNRSYVLFVNFSSEVSHEDLAKHLSILDDRSQSPLEFTVDTRELTKSHRIRIQHPSSEGPRIQMTISDGLIAVDKTVLLEPNVSVLEWTPPKLFIEDLHWLSQSREGLVVSMRLNSTISLADVQKHLSVTPGIGELKVIAHNDRRYTIYGAWRRGVPYTVSIAPGVTFANGTVSTNAATRNLEITSVHPTLEFSHPGKCYFTMREGSPLSLLSMGLTNAEFTTYRVFPSNIVYALGQLTEEKRSERYYSRRRNSVEETIAQWSEKLTRKTINLTFDEDEVKQTAVALDEHFPPGQRGIFCVVAEYDTPRLYLRTDKLVMLTNIGILSHWQDDALVLFAHNLFTLAPLPGARVSVYSTKKQLMGMGHADEKGIVKLGNFNPELGIPQLAVVEHENDAAFLELNARTDDTPEIGPDMPPYNSGRYDTYIYADRDLYRPGETVHLRWLVRTNYGDALANVPLEFLIIDPRKAESLGPKPVTLSEFGTGQLDFASSKTHPTGRYVAMLRIPGRDNPPLGTYEFQLEDFVPNRLKTTVELPATEMLPGTEYEISVKAQHLFGASAADRKAACEVVLEKGAWKPEAWPGYTFSNDIPLPPERVNCGEQQTNDAGIAKFTFSYVPTADATFPLTASVAGNVFELGGRVVTNVAKATFFPSEVCLGIRANDAPSGSGVEVHVAAVKPDGAPADVASVKVTLERQVWNYYVRRFYSNYESNWTDTYEEIETRDVPVQDGRGTAVFDVAGYGQYRVRVHSEETPQFSTVTFYSYWYGGRVSFGDAARPTLLKLSLDKQSYSPGETAHLHVDSPFDGRGVLVIQGEEIRGMIPFEIKENRAEIPIPIVKETVPNLWLEVTALHEVKTDRAQVYPFSSFAMTPLMVTNLDRKLEVTFPELPEEVRPLTDARFDVLVKDGNGDPVEAELTLAAVDEGIHAITDYQNPDPYGFFSRPRKPDYRRAHYYDKVAYDFDNPGFGGDGQLRRRAIHIGENWIKPVALWSGVVKTSAEGKASITLSLPEFAGQLRLVAVGSSKTASGTGARDLFVRRPFILRTSVPRFLLPGDSAECTAVVFNTTDQPASATVSWAVSGPLRAESGEQKIAIQGKGEARVTARFTAEQAVGQGMIIWRAVVTDADGNPLEDLKEEAAMPIRPSSGYQSQHDFTTLEPGKSQTFANELFLENDYTEVALSVTADPTSRLERSVRFLSHYPYGCIEQTVSGLMPLYLLRTRRDMVRRLMPNDEDLNTRIEAGIQRIFTIQTPNGGLSFWPGGYEPYPYGSLYALHFLSILKNDRQFTIPDAPYKGLQRYARSVASDWSDNSESHLYQRAYALYVLALGGDAEAVKQIRRFDNIIMPQPGRYLLAAALAYATQDADRVKMYLTQMPSAPYEAVEQSAALSSDIRNKAVELMALQQMGGDPSEIHERAETLIRFFEDRGYGNTQETAFAITALCAYLAELSRTLTNPSATIVARGAEHRITGGDLYTDRHTGPGGSYVVTNTGESPMFVNLTTQGFLKNPSTDPVRKGIGIEREILTKDGVPHGEAEYRQTDTFIVHLTIHADRTMETQTKQSYVRENLVVVDMLPAGFEIENPRLAKDPPSVKTGDGVTPAYTDIRDDRIVLAFGRLEPGTYHYYYVVRAVTPGVYQYPAAAAECMYDAQIHGASVPSMVTVTAVN